jgi:hypothetical protein
MKEPEFLGNLLPSSPDFLPIILAIRDKYKLPEISPDDDPIKEIYLGDEVIPLEEFHRDIENQIRENLGFMPPDTAKLYKSAKLITETKEISGFELLPSDLKSLFGSLILAMKNMMQPVVQILDNQIDYVVDMLYIFLLTGETEEAPNDWFGSVTTVTMGGEPMILAMANEITNLDQFIQQIREAHKKSFGVNHPKITDKVVSTAYYLRLKREKKPWNYIVEEYIRRNVARIPKNRNSERYIYIRHTCEQKLKKRMQRTEKILELIIRDKK